MFDNNEKITGDYLAESLNTIILNKKIEIIKSKLNDYFDTIDITSVDIPDFCKPAQQRRDFLINNFIRDVINGNTLDYYYNMALQTS